MDTPQKKEIPQKEESYTTARWQRDLLPLMKRMIIGVTLFFFIVTFGQLVYLHLTIEDKSELDLSEAFSSLETSTLTDFEQKATAAKGKSMILLEAYSLQRRHHQANVALMSRVWARYLGFVTGMILAMIGGVFILGKLETPQSEIGAKTSGTEFSFKSASPGLILSALGVALMMTTIISHHEIEVIDKRVYTNEETFSTAGVKEKKPELSLPPLQPKNDSDN